MRHLKTTGSTFDDVTDDVILCNVGGLVGGVIPLNLTDRLYIIIECIVLKSIRGREGTRTKPGNRLVVLYL